MNKFESLNEEIEKCVSLFEKYNDTKLVANKLNISETLVKKYIKFSRLPRKIQNMIKDTMPYYTPKKILLIILKTINELNSDFGNIHMKKFDEIYLKYCQIEFKNTMDAQTAYRVRRHNIGRLCFKCDSTKQAIRSGDKIIDSNLVEAITLLSGEKYLPESIPIWKCMDCEDEWTGDMHVI